MVISVEVKWPESMELSSGAASTAVTKESEEVEGKSLKVGIALRLCNIGSGSR